MEETQVTPRRRRRTVFQPTEDFRTVTSGGTVTHPIQFRKEKRDIRIDTEEYKQLIQDIAILTIWKTDFLSKVHDIIDPDSFGKNISEVLKLVFLYYEKYNEAPAKNFGSWFEKEKKRIANNEEREIVEHLLKEWSNREIPNQEMIEEHFEDVISLMSWDRGIVDLRKLREKGSVDDLRERAKEILVDTTPTELLETAEDEVKFPVEVIAGAAEQFVNIYREPLESPPQFFYFSFLTCLGNILADRVKVSGLLKGQPRMYTVLLGESSDTRKSTAAIETIDFFKWMLGELDLQYAFFVINGIGSAPGVTRKIKNGENPLLVFLDEFKTLVDKANMQGSVILSLVNTLFDSNQWANPLKEERHSIDIENGCLSLLAASTVKTFLRSFGENFSNIGFTNRLWLVPGFSERKDFRPLPIPEARKHGLLNVMHPILKQVEKFTVLPVDADADDMLQDWYMEPRVRDSVFSKRLEAYGLKLLSLLAVNEGKDRVDTGIAEKVIKLLDWQLRARKIYAPLDIDTRVGKVIKNILRRLQVHKDGYMTKGVLQNKCNVPSQVDFWSWDKAIEGLINHKMIRSVKHGKGYKLLEAGKNAELD